MINGVLLDLSGVLYDGGSPIQQAAASVRRLRDAGLPLRFVSNTTRSAKSEILVRLGRLGIKVGADELFTPVQAARDWLKTHDCSAHLLIHPELEPDFRDLPSGSGIAVVIGDAADAFDYASLNAAFRLLSDGAAFLALADNRVFKDADGKLSLDAGPFVRALEFACGRKATVLGKPAREFFLSALASMDCPPGAAVMVGDDAESDVAGAMRAGFSVALLVRTGKYRDGDETRFEPQPTGVVEDIAAAADWILAHR
ncbi:HAD superfamily hydrolase (TIGR01458 family) [Pseudaminobacter salicylatoxidans]|uniref:Phospholysine phosphohistidine inorganic pyrophosphate phosphatase n=2 Tax=Pseudaminobacter salicylatoxidans TaxID=93369 RepID=A0A316C0H2_PSESE|nr:TIGR01458 family HAD-type hydrolase [Pseudaminobacter salicylatoxidans]PWJ80990.1 HAD superfamily hydrolase (TIGR01458 family) [Pseudaminobacter salicylatoxidans]